MQPRANGTVCALCAFRWSRNSSLLPLTSFPSARSDTFNIRNYYQVDRASHTSSLTRRVKPANVAGTAYRRISSAHKQQNGSHSADNTDRRTSSKSAVFRPLESKSASKPQNRTNVASDRGYLVETNEPLLKTIILEQTAETIRLLEADLLQKTISAKRGGEVDTAEVQRWGIRNVEELKIWTGRFEVKIRDCITKGSGGNGSSNKDVVNPLWGKLRVTFVNRGLRGLVEELKYSFSSLVLESSFSVSDIKNQGRLADLRFPIEWYPATRAVQRKVHLHVGPTNSGKTYQALRRLETAKTGIYAGPLRLLAHEVYTRLNAKGKKCALITGEERRVPEDQDANTIMSSCTVEMVPLNADVDIAVIDEIQMMGDTERGWAWTQAFLGLKAKELHLCGEVRTVPLIKDLCNAMGEELVIHNYERLSPLKVAKDSLRGDLRKLEKGDCVILFTRVGIHAMKKDIEAATGRRCAVVYGSLPPETRAQQASLFNDPDNDYDYLVASDAVGMGLNLSIKRIIFEATSKFDGSSFRTISVPEIKQIAGRAGRYRTASQAMASSVEVADTNLAKSRSPESTVPIKKKSISVGLVTTLENFDMAVLRRAMTTEVSPLATAGILPPASVVARFSAYFPPQTPFSYILLRLHEICTTHQRFHLCRFKDQVGIADCIQPFNLTITDRMIFIAAPVNLNEPGMYDVCKAMAKCVSDQSGGEILNIPEIKLELLDEVGSGKEYLKSLEVLHKALTLYLWLSYRFNGVFRSQPLAFHVKTLLEERIDACLDEVRMTKEQRKQRAVLRRRAAMQQVEALTSAPESVKRDPGSIEPELTSSLDWDRDNQTEPMVSQQDDVKTFPQALSL